MSAPAAAPAIILSEPQLGENIGACARAMANFGLSDLRLVNDYSVALERAKSAVDASAILAAAREFPTVADAIADSSLVVGTTWQKARVCVGPRNTNLSISSQLAERPGYNPLRPPVLCFANLVFCRRQALRASRSSRANGQHAYR